MRSTPPKSGIQWQCAMTEAQALANTDNKPVGVFWLDNGKGAGYFIFARHFQDRPPAIFVETVKPAARGGGNA